MSVRFARSARIGVAALVVLLVAALAMWGLVHSGTVDAWLTTRLAALLAPRVRFASARVVWWPRLGVVLNDVALVTGRAASSADAAATAASVTCRVRLAPLLSRRVEIAAVQVNELRVTLERTADGHLYAGKLDVLAAARAARGTGPGTRLPAVSLRDGEITLQSTAEDAGPPLRLHRVDGSIAPAGRGARGELTARLDERADLRLRGQIDALGSPAETPFVATIDGDGIDVASLRPWLPDTLAPLGAQGRMRVTAKLTGRGATVDGQASLELFEGMATWEEWRVSSPLRVAARATWNGDSISVSDGKLVADRLTRDALSAETIEAAFAYADGTMQIENVQLRACGGTWHGSGRAQLGESKTVEAAMTADDIDAAQLGDALRILGGPTPLPQFDAPLRLQSSATGTVGGTWSAHALLSTRGGAAWTNVRADGPLQLAADLAVTPARAGAPSAFTLSNGQAEASRVMIDQISVETVSAQFGYANDTISMTPLRCSAFGGDWTYRGTLPTGDAKRWNGDLNATGIDADALRSALALGDDRAPASGRFDLTAQLTGSGTNSVTATATARLTSDALAWNVVTVQRPAEISTALRLQERNVALTNGRVRARAARVRGTEVSDLRGGFSYTDDHLRFSKLQAHAFGGRWQVDGALALAGPLTGNGTLHGRRINFDALLRDAAGVRHDAPRSKRGIADVNVHLTSANADGAVGSADVRLASGTFTWDDLRVDGPARATSAFAVRDGAITITNAAALAVRAAFGPLVATTATAHFDYAKDRLTFADLRFQSCGGAWRHSGWFTLDEGGDFAGQLAVDGAVPNELQAMFGDAPGDIDFARLNVECEFRGDATADWLQRLHATGAAFMSDGTARSTAVLRAIWEALAGRGRVTDAMNRVDRRTHIQQITGTFDLRHGQFTTSNASMVSDDYTATAVGTVGVDGTLDLEARILLTSQGLQRMLILGSMPLPTRALPGLPPIPADITGTLDKPVILPNLSALPASTLRWMVEAVLRSPHTVGSAVVDHLRSLWDGTKRAIGAGGDNEQPSE